MSSSDPEPLFRLLQNQLRAVQKHAQAVQKRNAEGTLIQIPRTGEKLASAYEQFRNAAEYTEEHLLLQRAIRRFYKRNIFVVRRRLDNIGEELVVELTHAGYLRNNSVSDETANAIRQCTKKYMGVYGELRQADVGREHATRWVLDIMSVETEEMLNPHGHLTALAYTAYEYYLRLFPRKKLSLTKGEAEQFEASLYVAIHLALLKSDSANIRQELMEMHKQDPHDTPLFIGFNQSLDTLLSDPFTLRLKRAVSRYGAPLRVLKEMTEGYPDMVDMLDNREAFMAAYDQQVSQEYRRVRQKLSRGITKSVAFLLITKVIVGIAIEIPYDILVLGHVAVVPLVINLLFPSLYIASLWFVIRPPTRANAAALKDSIDAILFSRKPPLYGKIRLGPRQISGLGRIAYGVLFMVPLITIIALLKALGFTFVQGLIFFVFMSTASFLGFRLSRIVRELEIVTKRDSFLESLGDFFYLPFIMIGQWLSSKYARVNAVAYFMDVTIELPLKTMLRLTRQWTRFLNERRDEIY